MTQVIPSPCEASYVSRIEPRSEADPCTTVTPLLRIEVGTLAYGSTAQREGLDDLGVECLVDVVAALTSDHRNPNGGNDGHRVAPGV